MMYTVICEYYATGEGIFRAVMYTRGYGPSDSGLENARESFAKKFGSYYATCAEVHKGLVFEFPGSETLVSEGLKRQLLAFVRDAGGLEYEASFYANFS